MTEDAVPDIETSEAAKPPASLVHYLSGDAPSGLYIAALEKRTVKLPDDQERQAGLELIAAEPGRLSKVVDLARAVADGKRDPRVRNAIHGWALAALRTREGLAEWGRLNSDNAEIQLRQLTKRLRDARSSKAEKAVVAEAEHVFLIGLAIAGARLDFSVIGALVTIYDGLQPSDASERAVEERAKKAMTRASVKSLETYGLINKVVSSALVELRAQFGKASQDLQNTRERNRQLQDDIARLSSEIDQLRAEKQSAAAEMANARSQLEGVKGGAAHDMIEVKARFRRLLIQKLTPFVNDASVALEVEPPVLDVAKVRVNLVKAEINKELEWLNQFSD